MTCLESKKKEKVLRFISNRQRRKEGTFCALGLAGIKPTPARSGRAEYARLNLSATAGIQSPSFCCWQFEMRLRLFRQSKLLFLLIETIFKAYRFLMRVQTAKHPLSQGLKTAVLEFICSQYDPIACVHNF